MAIIGIIAAVALPKLISLKNESELATLRAVSGNFRSAVRLVQTKFNILGLTTRIQNLPAYGAGNVDTNNIGFPIGIDKGNGNENIGRGNAGCQGVWQGILETSLTASTGSDTDFQTYRHTGNKVCSYVYRKGGDTLGRASAELVIQYDSRDGQVYLCGSNSNLAACPF